MGWTLRCSQHYLKDLGQTAPCKGLKTLQCIQMFFNSVFTEGLPQWILLEIYPRNMAFRIWRNSAHHEDVIALEVLLLNQIFQVQVYLDKVLNWTSEVHDKLSDLVENFGKNHFLSTCDGGSVNFCHFVWGRHDCCSVMNSDYGQLG
jgi:hypothetical protein